MYGRLVVYCQKTTSKTWWHNTIKLQIPVQYQSRKKSLHSLAEAGCNNQVKKLLNYLFIWCHPTYIHKGIQTYLKIKAVFFISIQTSFSIPSPSQQWQRWHLHYIFLCMDLRLVNSYKLRLLHIHSGCNIPIIGNSSRLCQKEHCKMRVYWAHWSFTFIQVTKSPSNTSGGRRPRVRVIISRYPKSKKKK